MRPDRFYDVISVNQPCELAPHALSQGWLILSRA